LPEERDYFCPHSRREVHRAAVAAYYKGEGLQQGGGFPERVLPCAIKQDAACAVFVGTGEFTVARDVLAEQHDADPGGERLFKEVAALREGPVLLRPRARGGKSDNRFGERREDGFGALLFLRLDAEGRAEFRGRRLSAQGEIARGAVGRGVFFSGCICKKETRAFPSKTGAFGDMGAPGEEGGSEIVFQHERRVVLRLAEPHTQGFRILSFVYAKFDLPEPGEAGVDLGAGAARDNIEPLRLRRREGLYKRKGHERVADIGVPYNEEGPLCVFISEHGFVQFGGLPQKYKQNTPAPLDLPRRHTMKALYRSRESVDRVRVAMFEGGEGVMSGLGTIAAGMRTGVFFTLAFVVLVSLALGFGLGATLAAPRAAPHEIRALLALLSAGGLHTGEELAERSVFEEFAGRVLKSGFARGLGIFQHGKLIYEKQFDALSLTDAVREAAASPRMRGRLIDVDGRTYFMHPLSELDKSVLVIEFDSVRRPWRWAFGRAANGLAALPLSALFGIAGALILLILFCSFALTWRYLTRPLSQTLSMLEVFDLSGQRAPKGRVARFLAPSLTDCFRRMLTRDENAARGALVFERRKVYEFGPLIGTTAYAGEALKNGYADLSPSPDGRYALTLLALPALQDDAALARVVLANEACGALANGSAERASALNKFMRQTAPELTAHAACAFLDPAKGTLDLCLLGRARLLRYDPRSQRFQGYDQGQAAVGSLDPAVFDGRLGYSQLTINKGETLFFVAGDLDWEDLVKQILKKAETDAEKQQLLSALLRQRCDEKKGALALMLCFG